MPPFPQVTVNSQVFTHSILIPMSLLTSLPSNLACLGQNTAGFTSLSVVFPNPSQHGGDWGCNSIGEIVAQQVGSPGFRYQCIETCPEAQVYDHSPLEL